MTLTQRARLQKLKRTLCNTSTALVKVTRNAEQNRRDTVFLQLLDAQWNLLLTNSDALSSFRLKVARNETKDLLKRLDNAMHDLKGHVRVNLQGRYERDKILADQLRSQLGSPAATVAFGPVQGF